MVKIGSWPDLRFLAAMTAAVSSAPLTAATANGTMAVSLTVEEDCHLDVRPLRFEASRSDAPGSGGNSSLAVACTPETQFVVSLDDGQHHADGARRMVAASGSTVAYELYSDAARTRRWGAGQAESVTGEATGASAVTLPIYGRVLTPQADAGAYSDIVTVTVSF